MRSILKLLLGGVILAGPSLADDLPEGDPESGRKVAGLCRTCHGLDGVARIPIAPHIAGESVTYIVAQLLAFREGRREHEMMSVVARGLTDQQVSDVAAWYAAHTPSAELKAAKEDAPELCVSCHGVEGIAVVEDAPHLAGETNIYIETQLKAFRSGKRVHEAMNEIAAGLEDNEIRDLANWYADINLKIAPPDL